MKRYIPLIILAAALSYGFAYFVTHFPTGTFAEQVTRQLHIYKDRVNKNR